MKVASMLINSRNHAVINNENKVPYQRIEQGHWCGSN